MKIMEKDLDLDEVSTLANSIEAMKEQVFGQDSKAGWRSAEPEVNKVNVARTKWSEILCNRCGRRGHSANFDKCPAKNKNCNQCGMIGHFASRCQTKKRKPNDISSPDSHTEKKPKVESKVNQIETLNKAAEEEDMDYAFYFDSIDKIACLVGGVKVELIIDSGATANIIGEKDWTMLKNQKIKLLKQEKNVNKKLTSYANAKPLEIMGCFDAEVQVGNKKEVSQFLVVKDGQKSLMGNSLAKQLEILKINLDVDQITGTEIFPKLKGIQIKLDIDPEVPGVFQPYRRVPISVEKLVAERIEELLKKDIIEKVMTHTQWASPLVVVTKSNGDIRLCVDMRRANLAIRFESYPFPTAEDLMAKLDAAAYFSKIDIKDAYHQVELAQESRFITTFITKDGLYRFKRLMFGMRNAPADYQKTMAQVLLGLDGVFHLLDDILIYGPTQEIHNERLNKVLNILEAYNFCLNHDKCVYGVQELVFLGWNLSAKGISPTEDKIDSIKNFREPKNADEIRSFLGLVNF